MEAFLVILTLICFVSILARNVKVNISICLFLAGIATGYMPWLHFPEIPPEMMLGIFLPPLLFEAAYTTSLRDLKHNAIPILLLAVGLVIATTVTVALVFTGFADSLNISVPLALGIGAVLGAIVSPPDAVAAGSIFKTLHVPRRITTILEGESLINDATGLILYSFAVAAIVHGHFSFSDAAMKFCQVVVISTLLGLVVGWIYIKAFAMLKDNSIEIISSFITPYLVYIAAEHIDASGVLAVVVAGITISWRLPFVSSPEFRMNASSIWRMVTFILNSIVFLIMGHELPKVISNISTYPTENIIKYAVIVIVSLFAIRFIWVYIFSYLPKFTKSAKYKKLPHWSNVFIVAWTSMRGVVSLAVALSLPLTQIDGTDFPHRDLIIFLAVVVIIFTFIIQGITLPLLLKKLPLSYNPDLLMEDWQARHKATLNALAKINEICSATPENESVLKRLKSFYEDRLAQLGDGPNTPLHPTEIPDTAKHPALLAEHKIWNSVVEVERDTIMGMRKKFEIGDSVMNEIVRDLDMLANRFRV